MTHPDPAPHLTAWPPGVPHHIDVPDESLWTGLQARAQQQPDEVGLHFLGQDICWRDLHAQAVHLAGALQALGLTKGDRVLLFMQNCPHYVVAFHAVLKCGAVVVPVNPMSRAVELEHYLCDTQARIAFSSSDIAAEMALAHAAPESHSALCHLVQFDWADAVVHASPQDIAHWPAPWQTWLLARPGLAPIAGVSVHGWQPLLDARREPVPVSVSGNDLALLPYTSGTTGQPKGCMHTHATLLHNVLAAAPWLDMRPGDATLIVVPLFHITGLVMGMLASIRHGCRMVILPRWDRLQAAQTIGRQHITHWPNIPTMVMDLMDGNDLDPHELSSLRYIGGGGAPMPDAVAQHLQQSYGLTYIEGYGLTETAAPTHTNPRHAPRRACLGIPYIGTSALVIDPETRQLVPPGESGEIVVSGPQVFKGYWHQEQATRDAFIDVGGQTYFRTGDLGRVDADGYFYIADRLKRMINASGFKVWPAEVEALLHRHPAVQEACVIAMRDAYRGESVKALVVLKQGLAGTLREADLIAWAREYMSVYKCPRHIDFVSALPRSASGKLMWRIAQAEQDARDRAAAAK